MGSRQNLGKLILGPVGILILVHQNILEAALVLHPHLFMLLQQKHRYHQQVIKIQSIVVTKLLGIDFINLCHLLLKEAAGIPGHGLGSHKLVFGIGNSVQHPGWSILLLIQIEFFQCILDDSLAVRRIVNNKVLLVNACSLYLTAQETGTERMEGAEPYLLGRLPNHAVHTLPHLRGSLVGKGDGQNAVGGHIMSQQVCHLAGQHLGLAGTCPRHDKQRPISMLYRLFLCRIQSTENIQNILLKFMVLR